MTTQSPEDKTSQNETEETTSQNTDKTENENKNKDTEKSDITKQQEARAIKAEQKAKELAEKLAKYEEEEEQKRKSELEKKGEYEKLINEVSQKETTYKERLEALENENKTYRETMERLESEAIAELMSKIPEDKREIADDMVSAYKGSEKIEKLKKLTSVLAVEESKSFGGMPPVKKETVKDRYAELKLKVDSHSVTPKEFQEYKELKSKHNF